MRSWLRTTIPLEYAGAAFLGYALMVVIPWIAFHVGQGRGPFVLFNKAGLVPLTFMAASFGAYRVMTTHPALRPEYRRWLTGTPWRLGLPLPLGPVSLALQDLVAVAVLAGLAALHPESIPQAIPALFLAGYLITAIASELVTGQFVHAFLVTFGLGGALYLAAVAWPGAPRVRDLSVAVTLAILYGIVWHGIRDSLARFRTWQLDGAGERFYAQCQIGSTEMARKQLLGWPFDRLGPHRLPAEIPLRVSAAVAFLMGWWYFVIAALLTRGLPNVQLAGLLPPLIPLVLALGLVRFCLYAWGYAPPINLWGRVATFRWIIPGYDLPLLLPLPAGIALLVAGARVIDEFGLSPLHAVPVLVSLEIFLFLSIPPGLVRWRMTGNHRIVAGASSAGTELQQTP